MAVVLGGLLAGGIVTALVVSWLTSRRVGEAQALGRLIAVVTTAVCAFVIVILIGDNGIDRDLRLAGSLVILDCALVAGLVMWAALRSRSSLRQPASRLR